MRLQNKVAVITGAASGIGRAAAVLFAKEGAKVVVADINDEGGKETVNLIEASGGEGTFVHTDVTQAQEVQNMIKTAVETYGKLDILYNNAGVPGVSTPSEFVEEADWDCTYAVNVKSIFLACKYAIPQMKQQGGGVIINTTSVSADRPRPNMACYVSSKGAAEVLTKALALELAPQNIRVNCVNPVLADTPMAPKFIPKGLDPEPILKAVIESTIPMGRMATAEEVAYGALYLACDESSFVTGIALPVDGGRSI